MRLRPGRPGRAGRVGVVAGVVAQQHLGHTRRVDLLRVAVAVEGDQRLR